MSRDLRRAALRVVVLLVPLLAAVGLGRADATLLVTGAVAGALLVPISLLELRAAERPGRDEPLAPFAIWVAAAGALLLVGVEHAYVSAARSSGSLDGGVVGAWRLLDEALGRRPLRAVVWLLMAASPFALAAHMRLRGFEPRSTLFVAAALLMVPVLLGLAVVPLLLWAYKLADALEERMFRPGRAARAAFAAETDGLSYGRLWLLAYLGHAPAQHALGRRAPAPQRDLDAFVRGLEPAGHDVAARALLAATALVVPFQAEARGADPVPRAVLAALEAWRAEPTAARREAVRALLLGWAPGDEGPAARALRESAAALEEEPRWATRSAINAAARVAGLAGLLMDDPAAVREGLRTTLLEWALVAPERAGEGSVAEPAQARGAPAQARGAPAQARGAPAQERGDVGA